MNKILQYIGLALLLPLVLISGCDTWEEDINHDKLAPPYAVEEGDNNNPDGFSPELFMSDMLYDVIDGWDYIHWNVGAAVCEYHGKTKSLSQGNRHKSWHALEYVWEPAYKSVKVIKNMRQSAIQRNDKRYQAIADIWESYNFFSLTLLYGDIPYSETIMDNPPLQPKYDKQSELYPALMQKLKAASLSISDNDRPIDASSDVIFRGDIQKWRKFANTLLVRYAMYMSDVAPDSAIALLNEIVGNPQTFPLMESNDDNAGYHYDGVKRTSWVYRLSKAKIEEAPFSNIFIERLISLKDPRLPVYARPVENIHNNASCNVLPSNPGSQKYAGHIYGITSDNAHAVLWNNGPTYASKLGTFFRTENGNGEAALECADMPFYLALYSELQFFLAEAAEKGWLNSGDAKTYYEAGIHASFEQYNARFESAGYSQAFGSSRLNSVDEYLTQAQVAYNGGRNKLLLIAEQKWIASFMLGFEPYFDHRRTMLPPLRVSSRAEDHAFSGSGSKFPSRAAYPDSELAENTENINMAKATGFDIPIVNDETRNEALMWLLSPKGQEGLRMKIVPEPQYPSEYPCISGNSALGTRFTEWYNQSWQLFFWWQNNDQ